MSGRILNRLVLAAAAIVLFASNAGAQAYGSYTPYSCFGVGDLFTQGSAYNQTMGGVGIAGRNNSYLNPLNPAAVSARDTLTFMIDYSIYQDNKYFRQGDMKGAGNTFNIGNLMVTFPIWRTSAMSLGIMPYSSSGYAYSYSVDDPSILGSTGGVDYSATGQGSLYQAYAGVGVTFWRRLSIGAQANYIFGKNGRSYNVSFTDKSYNGANNGYNMQLSGFNGKFGVQYVQSIGKKSTITAGATYTMKTKLNGYSEGFKFSSGTVAADTLYYKMDTLANHVGTPALASEIGVGLCYCYSDKFMAEFDYTRSDWTGTGLDSTPGFMGNTTPGSNFSAFSTTVSNSYRLGLEFTPNRNDIRYYLRKCSYRMGAYYRNEYYKLDGRNVNTAALTLGLTLPITRQDGLKGNGVTLGMELGQRGANTDNMIRERFVNFCVGFNLYDIWFVKPKYN